MEEINIKKMNVAQVRRALFVLRSNWENHTPANPFCLSETMEGVGMTYSEFCFNLYLLLTRENAVQAKTFKKETKSRQEK